MIHFSEDVRSVGDLKKRSSKLISQVIRTRRPTLLTRRGHGVAVLIELGEFETMREELEMLRGVNEGLDDLDAGRTVKHEAVFARLAAKRGKRIR